MRRGQRLQEPDVRDRRGELDVAHALAAHLGQRHLDAALFADQALVLHALVLAAQALVVLDRSEDARAEQAVTLRLERAIVDGLRLLDLAERPRVDVLRAGDRDLDAIEGRGLHLGLEEVRDLVHRGTPGGTALTSLGGFRYGQMREPAIGSPVSRSSTRRHSAAAGGSCGFGAVVSSGAISGGGTSLLTRSTLRPSARISLTSTLKLSGMPASKVSSPRTIAS